MKTLQENNMRGTNNLENMKIMQNKNVKVIQSPQNAHY